MPDIKRMQRDAHQMIVRWGGGAKKGFLIRSQAKRPCTIARMEIKPTERGLYVDGSNKFAISAFDLVTGLDHEQDIIQFKGQLFRIILPVSGPTPDGTVVFWTAITMYAGPAA